MKQVEFGDKNVNLRWAGVKEYFWKHLEEESRRIVKRLLVDKSFTTPTAGLAPRREEGLRVELDYQIGTGRYRRGVERRDYRNGYYLRDLVTSLGMISSFLVPRSRKGV